MTKGAQKGQSKTAGGIRAFSGTKRLKGKTDVGINKRLIDAACDRWQTARGDSNGDWRANINTDSREALSRRRAQERDPISA